jgi:hypothetical protein
LKEKVNIDFKVPENPLLAVARGSGIAMKHLGKGVPYLFK